jgi:Pirin
VSVQVHRAADRFHTVAPGIETWHSFSAGAHYAADNVAFGALVGMDEHLLAPGAGFDWHPHRDITIVSYVQDGMLAHEDAAGRRMIGAGEFFVQEIVGTARHAERNASDAESLHLVQVTALPGAEEVRLVDLPCRLFPPRGYGYLLAGSVHLGRIELHPGDDVRVTDEAVELDGAGHVLLWQSRV